MQNPALCRTLGGHLPLLSSLARLSSLSDHLVPSLLVELSRLVCNLVSYAADNAVTDNILTTDNSLLGGLLTTPLDSPHLQLNNEAVVALNVVTAGRGYGVVAPHIDLGRVVERLAAVLANNGPPAEMRHNCLVLVNTLAGWRDDGVLDAIRNNNLLDMLDGVDSDMSHSIRQIMDSNT